MVSVSSRLGFDLGFLVMSYKHELTWIVQQENVTSLDKNKLLACIIVISVEIDLGILLFQVIILKAKKKPHFVTLCSFHNSHVTQY